MRIEIAFISPLVTRTGSLTRNTVLGAMRARLRMIREHCQSLGRLYPADFESRFLGTAGGTDPTQTSWSEPNPEGTPERITATRWSITTNKQIIVNASSAATWKMQSQNHIAGEDFELLKFLAETVTELGGDRAYGFGWCNVQAHPNAEGAGDIASAEQIRAISDQEKKTLCDSYKIEFEFPEGANLPNPEKINGSSVRNWLKRAAVFLFGETSAKVTALFGNPPNGQGALLAGIATAKTQKAKSQDTRNKKRILVPHDSKRLAPRKVETAKEGLSLSDALRSGVEVFIASDDPVPAGMKYSAEIRLSPATEVNIDSLKQLLQFLESERDGAAIDWLGGRTSAGLGRVRLINSPFQAQRQQISRPASQRKVSCLDFELMEPTLVSSKNGHTRESGSNHPADLCWVKKGFIQNSDSVSDLPYIPGSTLRGAMRAEFGRIARTLFPDNAEELINEVFGRYVNNRQGAEQPTRGKLWISDGTFKEPDSLEKSIVIQDRVAIDRLLGRASDDMKFDNEIMLPGKRFTCYLVHDGLSENAEKVLDNVRDFWKRGWLWIGYNHTKGMGRLKLLSDGVPPANPVVRNAPIHSPHIVDPPYTKPPPAPKKISINGTFIIDERGKIVKFTGDHKRSLEFNRSDNVPQVNFGQPFTAPDNTPLHGRETPPSSGEKGVKQFARMDHANDNEKTGRPCLMPYNFVRNPEKVKISPENNINQHDKYYLDERKTGYMEVELQAFSPLIISHPARGDFLLSEDEQRAITAVKNAGCFGITKFPDSKFNSTPSDEKWRQRIRPPWQFSPGNFVIPNSSLRGMLRSVYEAITGSFHGVINRALDGRTGPSNKISLKYRCDDCHKWRAKKMNTKDVTAYTYSYRKVNNNKWNWKRWIKPGNTPWDKLGPYDRTRNDYKNSLADLVFGAVGWDFAKASREVEPYAGRIRIGWGRAKENVRIADKYWFLRPLTEPKGGTPPHGAMAKCEAIYLYNPRKPDSLARYDDDVSRSRIRGRKFYLHHGTVTNNDTAETWRKHVEGHVLHQPETKSFLRPLLPDSSFCFEIHFTNLSDTEFGALLWAIEPATMNNGVLYHKLGRAKPLGFGSVKLTIKSISLLEKANAGNENKLQFVEKTVDAIEKWLNEDAFGENLQETLADLAAVLCMPGELKKYDYWKNWTDYQPDADPPPRPLPLATSMQTATPSSPQAQEQATLKHTR